MNLRLIFFISWYIRIRTIYIDKWHPLQPAFIFTIRITSDVRWSAQQTNELKKCNELRRRYSRSQDSILYYILRMYKHFVSIYEFAKGKAIASGLRAKTNNVIVGPGRRVRVNTYIKCTPPTRRNLEALSNPSPPALKRSILLVSKPSLDRYRRLQTTYTT